MLWESNEKGGGVRGAGGGRVHEGEGVLRLIWKLLALNIEQANEPNNVWGVRRQ